MGSTNAILKYAAKDCVTVSNYLDAFTSIEKITIDGKECDAIIPNRKWCCSIGFTAMEMTENDILIKTKLQGWIPAQKPLALQRKFTFISFEFSHWLDLTKCHEVMKWIADEYEIDSKDHRIMGLKNWYIVPSEETDTINDIVKCLNDNKALFTNIETKTNK
jgi:hypothetical protein